MKEVEKFFLKFVDNGFFQIVRTDQAAVLMGSSLKNFIRVWDPLHSISGQPPLEKRKGRKTHKNGR